MAETGFCIRVCLGTGALVTPFPVTSSFCLCVTVHHPELERVGGAVGAAKSLAWEVHTGAKDEEHFIQWSELQPCEKPDVPPHASLPVAFFKARDLEGRACCDSIAAAHWENPASVG